MIRYRSSVFKRLLVTLLIVGVVPVLAASLLLVNVFHRNSEAQIEMIYADSPAVKEQAMAHEQEVKRQNVLLAFSITVVSLTVTLFFALYISRTFTLPLQRIIQATELMSKGDLDVRLESLKEDEIGRLAGSFNKMAQSLSTVHHRLEKANHELEGRVADRTAQLSMINNELRVTAENLYEASKLKSEFLANVSHELRTPLNAIIGYTDLLLDGVYGDPNQQQQNSLSKIRRNSNTLLRLINDLLSLSRLEAGRMPVVVEVFDLANLIAETVEEVRALFDNKSLSLGVQIDPDVGYAQSDQGKIKQVLLNLLSNALKFTERGWVSVRASYDPQKDFIVVTVADSGIGISPDQFTKIFDQFRQVDGSHTRKYGGSGLGLAITRKMVTLLGGEITLESVVDKGSAFSVHLPRNIGQGEVVVEETEPRTGTEKLVVSIDDDPEVIRLLQESLEPEGYMVIGCTEGDQGVRRAQELLPFAITLDIMMPYRDGWSVLRELKGNPRTRDIPVVILSIVEDRPRGFELGADDYLIKPINRKALLETLQSYARMEDA